MLSRSLSAVNFWSSVSTVNLSKTSRKLYSSQKKFVQGFFSHEILKSRDMVVLSFIPVRNYARRTSTRVKEETQTGTGTAGLDVKDQQREGMWQYSNAGDEDQTTEQSLTPYIKQQLSKVYGTLMAGLGVSAASVIFGIMVPGLSFIGWIGSIVAFFALYFTDHANVTRRQNLFLAFCALTGLSISTIVGASSLGVILAAALGTSGIFAGFTLAAMKAKRSSMLMLEGVLFGGLMVVLLCSLGTLLLPLLGVTNPAILGALFNINIYLGLGVFSLYVAYDTQNMIESFRAGNSDHITPALNLFINIVQVFIRLLWIFGRSD